MGLLLYILAVFISPIGVIIGMISSVFCIRSWKEVDLYFYRCALSKDQFLNVAMRYFFNTVMIKDIERQRAYHFGNEDETISSAFGKNKRRGTLSKFGYFWDRFLHLLEKDHTIKAIEEDENEI